ncbi:MAG TPA: hypothetical protein VNY52_10355 [Solirubrobacteraceae bacterium]|nr:hypothetical protein [Solirubrobacteraceae bacterium]
MDQPIDRPPDIVIVLAVLSSSQEWFAADEIRSCLEALGHRMSTQQVASWLRRMCREGDKDYQAFEAESDPHFPGIRRYRVSRYGYTWVWNRFSGLRRLCPTREDESACGFESHRSPLKNCLEIGTFYDDRAGDEPQTRNETRNKTWGKS